jgi:hypothetical protein
MGYRLTGNDPVDQLCVKHLRGSIRVVVAFVPEDAAWVLLVGPHDARDPATDIYAELWQLLGVERPAGERTKPPCCGPHETAPAIETELMWEIIEAAGRRRR